MPGMITVTGPRGPVTCTEQALEDVWEQYAIGYCTDADSLEGLREEVAHEYKVTAKSLSKHERFTLAVMLAAIPDGGVPPGLTDHDLDASPLRVDTVYDESGPELVCDGWVMRTWPSGKEYAERCRWEIPAESVGGIRSYLRPHLERVTHVPSPQYTARKRRKP